MSWDVIRTKFLFQIKKRIVGEEGHNVLSITQKGIKIKDIESGKGQLSMDYSKYQIVESGDFAMNHMDLLTGYVDISKYKGVTSPDYRVFSNREMNTNSQFYLYVFQMGYINKIFFKYGQGSSHLGRWRLPADEFNDFQLPCPSNEEQTQIVAFLDRETAKIDQLIQKQHQLITLLEEKRQAVISHAVIKGLNPDAQMKDSGVEWFGFIPAHWNVAGFKKYLNKIIDYRGKTPEKKDLGIFLVTARNIKNGKIDYNASQEFIAETDYENVMSRGKPKIGDVLFTTEAPLGQVASVDRDDIALAQRIIKFDGKSGYLNNIYLKYLIMSDQFQQSLMTYATGSTALGIKAERLVYLRMLLPPVGEQLEIVSHTEKVISRVDILKTKAVHAVRLMKERRTALISAAVTGKIDVRNTI
jgi:type I restriction enzyme S subunit